jgi:hypothetical protein
MSVPYLVSAHIFFDSLYHDWMPNQNSPYIPARMNLPLEHGGMKQFMDDDLRTGTGI